MLFKENRSQSRQRNLSICFSLLFWFICTGHLVAQTHQDWSYDKALYEINVRQYSESGSFDAVRQDLDRIQSLGADILWLMPIHPIGSQNRLGTLGSYYAVRDYYGINPEFGDSVDLKALITEAHQRGMYVILDWVANHTAWDNPLTDSNPEWYVRNNGQFSSPPGTNWSDVIQLDHSQSGLRDYMVDAMRYWVEAFGVDGFRFDAVSFVPDDFWLEVLPRVKEARSDLFFLAEGEGTQWHGLGFDMNFSWGFYGFNGGVLARIAAGEAFASNLASYMNSEKLIFRNGQYRLYFTSNHDENSWEGTVYERFGNRAEVFAVLSATAHGMPLIYNGQEAGLNKRLAFFEKDEIPWRDHPNFELYQKLMALKKRNKALWNGDPENFHSRITTNQNAHIFAYHRQKEEDQILVIANVSLAAREVILEGNFFEGRYRNVFSGEELTIAANSIFTLPAAGYLVFEGVNESTSVQNGLDQLPIQTKLFPNYPNPFNPTTTIQYQLAESGQVRLSVYNMNGQLVQNLVNEYQSQGNYKRPFNASNLSSGIYLVHLESGTQRFVQKMVLVK